MVHAVIVFFYYLSYVNVYLKYVFAFSSWTFQQNVYVFLLLLLFCKFLGLDIVISFMNFLKKQTNKTKPSFDVIWWSEEPSSLTAPQMSSLSQYQRTFFPFYFDLAMYLYCL